MLRSLQPGLSCLPNDEALHELFSLIARKAGRRSLLITDRRDEYAELMKCHSSAMQTMDVRRLHEEQGGAFEKIIFMEVLENAHDKEGAEMLLKAWDLLSKKGRMMVIVPNDDVYCHEHQVRTFRRSRLRRMLLPFGRPKILSEQPFKWLVMYIEKRERNDSGKGRVMRSRFKHTVSLCHGKVLEFGCGSGLLSRAIHDGGFEVVGVDMNRAKILKAMRDYPDITFIRSDVMKLKFQEASYDTVIVPEILEHVPEETGREMLERAWYLIRPKGRLIVSVPNENCVPHPNHIRQFNRQSLTGQLLRFGEPRLVINHPYKWLMMYVDKDGMVLPGDDQPQKITPFSR